MKIFLRMTNNFFCARKLNTLMKGLGADIVMDTNLADHLYRLETREEFKKHLESGSTKPLLGSFCPGWICFAEKSHPEILDLISKVRSPQQITGVLVKDVLAKRKNLLPKQIYHVGLMMCFDKKLEASRLDFAREDIRDVDTVITSIELEELLDEKKIDFMSLSDAPFEQELGNYPQCRKESSGSYASDLYRHVAKTLHGMSVEEVPYKVGKNPDIKEACLEVEGKVVLKVGVSNGFRNIQNIVRQMKSKKGCSLNFVETMACPSGCLNGGGQIRASNPTDREQSKQKLQKVKEAFTNDMHTVESDEALLKFYNAIDKSLLYTQYHPVPPTPGLLIKW